MYILYLATKYIPFCTTCSTCKWKFSEWQSFRKHRLGGFHFGKNSMIFQERPLINIKLTKIAHKNWVSSCLFFLNTTGGSSQTGLLWRRSRSHRETTTVPSEPSDGYYAIGRCRLPHDIRLPALSHPPYVTLWSVAAANIMHHFSDDCATGFSFLKFN